MTPLISVITATLNRRELLIRALDSVVTQGLGNEVEHVVVDGESTDGTLTLLTSRPAIRFVSEPDKNVYDAWNKGVRLARGRVVCLLNSDDYLPKGALSRVAAAFKADPSAEMVSGAVELRVLPPVEAPARVIDAEEILALREQDIGPGIPITNGRFFARDLLERIGPFDDRWQFVSDRDWLLRALIGGVRNRTVRQCLYVYGLHKDSLTLAGTARLKLADESLRCSEARLREASAPDARAAYARWHAWALAYRAGIGIGRPNEALHLLARGTRADPLWWARLPIPLWRHVLERPQRAGQPVSP